MLRSAATLARWLGPWADSGKLPDVATRDDAVDEIRVRIYEPRRAPRATYLIAPGLHYAGADDPRLDRFCRILAAAGHLVVAPFVPDYLALTPNARAKRDFIRVFRALPRFSTQRPVVFSISFGSLLAFALAAEHGDELDGVVVFGGYCDFHATMRFCLTGEVASGRACRRDPLNQPVVFANLIDCVDPPPADPDALIAAWRVYVERTWGRPEMKLDNRFVAVAEALAPSVPASVRELFLVGIGARPGSLPIATAALARFDATALDPTPYLARISNRVDLLHGSDDDVIPYEQSHALAAQLADAHVHITGLYDHTGASRPSLRDAAREARTMVGMLRVLAR
jgi:pimeloyl-ACP methyl ester carboxylesterase